MAKDKTKNGSEAAETAGTVEPAPGRRSPFLDPWDRWGAAGEYPWRPSWFGRGWPDRLFGEFSGLLDHIKIEEYMDDDGSLVVRAEIPGVDPDEDIDISIENRRLVIRAERTSRTEDDTDGYRSEFHYGSFSRVVGLPDKADVDDIEAKYVDGILEVRVPIAEEKASPSKKVSIKRG